MLGLTVAPQIFIMPTSSGLFAIKKASVIFGYSIIFVSSHQSLLSWHLRLRGGRQVKRTPDTNRRASHSALQRSDPEQWLSPEFTSREGLLEEVPPSWGQAEKLGKARWQDKWRGPLEGQRVQSRLFLPQGASLLDPMSLGERGRVKAT